MVKNNRTKLLVSLIIAFVLSIGISFGFSFEKANAEDSTEVAIRTYDLYELNNSMSKRCGAGDYIGKIESPLNTSFKFKAEFSRLDITNHSVLSFYNSEYWGDNLLTLSGDKAYFGKNAWALANSVENPGNYYVSAACKIETDTEYVFEFGVKAVKEDGVVTAYQYFFKVDDELVLTYNDTAKKEIGKNIYAQNNACGGDVNNVLTISSLLTTQEVSKTYDFYELNNNLSKKFGMGDYIGSIENPLNTSFKFKANFSRINIVNHFVLSFYNSESWGDHLLTLSGEKAYFGSNAYALANGVENPSLYEVSAACKIEAGTDYTFEFGVREVKNGVETVAYQYFFKVDDKQILTYNDTEKKEIGKDMYAQNNACGADINGDLTISTCKEVTYSSLVKSYDFKEITGKEFASYAVGDHIGTIENPVNTSVIFKVAFSKIDVINHTVLSLYNSTYWGENLLTLSGSKAYFGSNAYALANGVENPSLYEVSAALKIDANTEYAFEFGVREVKVDAEVVAYQYFLKVGGDNVLSYNDFAKKEIGKELYAQNNACGGNVQNVVSFMTAQDFTYDDIAYDYEYYALTGSLGNNHVAGDRIATVEEAVNSSFSFGIKFVGYTPDSYQYATYLSLYNNVYWENNHFMVFYKDAVHITSTPWIQSGSDIYASARFNFSKDTEYKFTFGVRKAYLNGEFYGYDYFIKYDGEIIAHYVDSTKAEVGKDLCAQNNADFYANVDKNVTLSTYHKLVYSDKVPETCYEDGYSEGLTCGECGKVFKEVERIPKHHTESGWITDNEATCVIDGHKHIECVVCSEVLQEETIEHKHLIVIDEGYKPTCRDGLTEGSHCERCGEIIVEQKTIPAVSSDHIVSHIEGKNATCSEDGYTGYDVCAICGKTLSESTKIPAKGHNESEWIVDKEATENENGHKYKKCNNCGEILEEEVIPAVKKDDKPDNTDNSEEGGCFAGFNSGSYMFILMIVAISLVFIIKKRQKS